MLFLGVHVAGAEQDGEDRHAGGDRKGKADIVKPFERTAPELGGARYRIDRVGDGGELERDIGRDGDDCEYRDQDRKRARFAKTRRQEIGNRGDALVMTYDYKPTQDEPPADKDDGGSEIDRGKFEPATGGVADGAVKRPAGAVDRNREGINEGRAQEAAWFVPRRAVTQIGNKKE
jgi:hypothetical protein